MNFGRAALQYITDDKEDKVQTQPPSLACGEHWGHVSLQEFPGIWAHPSPQKDVLGLGCPQSRASRCGLRDWPTQEPRSLDRLRL